MLCSTCTTLSYLHTKKNCIQCHGEVLISLSVLCESCSNTQKVCAICLKKTNNSPTTRAGGCGCGK